MFKDECGGKHIKIFVRLRSKLYDYVTDDGKEEKKCKDVKKCVVRNEITIDDYLECPYTKRPQLRTMNTIQSRQHNVGKERINKTALSADDDKRVILEDKIHTLAIGHWRTQAN